MSAMTTTYSLMSTLRTVARRYGWSYGLGLAMLGMMQWGCETEEAEPRRLLDPITAHYLQEGTAALDAYRYEAALAYADSAEQRRPNAPDVAFLRGRTYAEMGDLERSDSLYRRVLALQPDYPGTWHNMGNNAYRQKRYSQAIAYHGRELEREPAPIPWRGIGRAYVELGKNDSARYALEQALVIDSSYAPAHFNLALLYEDEGDFDKALYHARQAWRLSPEDYDYRYLMASLMVKMGGDFEEAIPHLRAVAEYWPWHSASHYNLGQALVHLGRQEEGKELLERAEKLRALDAKIQHLLGTARSMPNDAMTHAALGSALRRAGRLQDALRAYRIAVHLDPTNLDIQNNVASIYLLQRDTLAAVQTYHHILQQDPSFAEVWVNLGVVYAISGEREKARRAWQAALQYEPEHEAAQAYLARLQRDRG